ncbi:SH3 and multiple ankyrin repeat domains protein 1-like isoform X2 [Mizuhopecten yessoensis]|uniref:SH3 and multiple ankyrin repeat domains protein 1-like isoform X2 n=1 Tax=Mizuhopecten yessoensis TaxID=6573 RepID=UPI000B457B77|nr:SH3 and multiple ankyrin repeat domains protein 1-like isoform X2 [Mizuhopecten yessoensis]
MDVGNPYHVSPNRKSYVGPSVTYNGVPAELRESNHYMESSFTSDNQTGTVFIRISIPDLKVQKCLQFELDETVWQAKQRLLGTFAKDLKDALNFGLYSPPINGRAGKFLEEERLLRHYPLQGPIGFLEFKYKRRVYKLMNLNPRKLKQINTKGNFKHFIDYVKNCNVEKVTKLANKGLDPNFHDSSTGETPLSQAMMLTKQKCRELIISLVGGGAHLDYRTKKGLTPLHRAVVAGNTEAVKTLLDLGASPNLKDARGLTPLYHCAAHSCNPVCVEMLLMEKAVIGATDEQGWMEIHQACHNGLVQHLEYLLSYGADMDIQNANGNTALHVCAINNQESCARVLLFRGASKDIVNLNHQTPYQAAIIAQSHDLILMLEQHRTEDVVPIREMPRYSNRRRDNPALQSIYGMSRSRSDPRINAISMMDDKYMTTFASMHNLAYLNNNHPDTPSGGYETDSPCSMSVSSASSGMGTPEYGPSDFRPSSLSYGSVLQNPLPQNSRFSKVPQRSHSMVQHVTSPTMLNPSSVDLHNHRDPLAICHKCHRLNVPLEGRPYRHSMYSHYTSPRGLGVVRRPSLQAEMMYEHSVHSADLVLDRQMEDTHRHCTRRPSRLSLLSNHSATIYNHPSPSSSSGSVGATISSGSDATISSGSTIQINGATENYNQEERSTPAAVSHQSVQSMNIQHSKMTVPNKSRGRNVVSLSALPMYQEPRPQGPILNLTTPESLHVCVQSYEATNPVELTLIKGEIVEVTGVSDQGYWEGRNMNGQEGWFPSDNVQEVRLRRRAGSLGDIMKVSRDNALNRNTLATLVHPYGSYSARTVVLQRGPEGYGFVLRGAKSQTNATGELDFCPTAEFPALQYLDNVDPGSRSDRAGLKPGDFLLEINGENVVRASHDRVVQLIRQAGDTLAMKVVTVQRPETADQWLQHQDGSMTLPVRGGKKAAPQPPQRNPRTSISLTKTQGKQIAEGMAELENDTEKESTKRVINHDQLDKVLAENDKQEEMTKEQKTASIRSSHSAKRVSCVELGGLDTGAIHSSEKYMSPSEMRIKKYHQKKASNGSVSNMERSRSTSDLLDSKRNEPVYATPVTVPSVASKHKRTASGSTDVVDKYDYDGGDSVSLKSASSYGGSTGNLKTATSERPKAPPPPPPGGSTVPKRHAPAPPKNVEPVRPAKTELVTISTNKKVYATTTEIKSSQVNDQSDQSSFKPANQGKSADEPKIKIKSTVDVTTSHQRNASSVSKHSDSSRDDASEKHSVSFAEDRVNDSAQKFLQKHPNAQLLVTADVHLRKKKVSEPEPDYDVDSEGENDKARNSVTVISVGDKKTKTESAKQLTIKRSDIPSSLVSKKQEDVQIPPPPQEPAPKPPTKTQPPPSPKGREPSPAPSPPRQASPARQPSPVRQATPPKEIHTAEVKEEVEELPVFAPPPPAPPAPPPPPPPLTQEASPSPRVGSRQTGDGPTTSLLPTGDILAAVRKRQTRMETEGPKLTAVQQKKQEPTDNQAAIMAAVARRRQHLEQKSDTDVLDQIESRLHKTKKLQSAKLFFSGENTGKKTETKAQELPKSKPASNVISKAKPGSVTPSKITPKVTPKVETKVTPKVETKVTPKVETKVTPKVETKVETKKEIVNRKATASTPMKPLFDSNAVGKVKVTENKKVVTKQKSIESDKDEKKPTTTDFLAMAEKARQDWLQKKASSSSLSSGSPTHTTTDATTARAKSEPPKTTVKENDSVQYSSKPTSPTPLTTSTQFFNTTDKPKVNGVVRKTSTSTPLKTSRDADLISRATSIRDRIASFEKNKKVDVTNGRINSTSPKSPRYKVQGVTTDSSATETGKTTTSALPPPPEFGDIVHVDIIPPPSGYKHEDTDSVVSSVSTLSTLSDEHADSGYCLSKKNSYEDLIPPPPPGFDDNTDQGYDEMPAVIPPPPDFESNKNNKVVVKPVRMNKPFLSKPVDTWQCLDVLDWLDSLNMTPYKPSFQEHCIDGKKLAALTRNDYIELGVTQVGHRMNLERSIKKAAMRNGSLS